MQEKIKIDLPIIVEGRYDKSTLASVFDATIVATNGFGIFNSTEKKALIRRLAEKGGIILLTDSDSGGRQIRSYLSGFLPKEKIFHLYTPEIKGKEARKKTSSKAGILGVEGMSREILVNLLSPFASAGACEENKSKTSVKTITKLDFFNDGLSGGAGSSEKRALLARHLGLPSDMSANSLLAALNIIVGYDGYRQAYNELFKGQNNA